MAEPLSPSGLLAVWVLGASMGLTACTATCLPFMGTWMVARAGGQGNPLRDAAGFIGGRIAAYTLLGTLAALAGQQLSALLNRGLGHLLIGSASLAAALWLLGDSPGHKPCALARRQPLPASTPVPFHPRTRSLPWYESTAPFAVGFSLSLVPCAPLASLLAICAQAGQAAPGAVQGLFFGLGAALSPLLVLLPLLGKMGERLRTEQNGRWLRFLGAVILAALGLRQWLQGLAAGGWL
ncbi:sulfite exporter TauE/SafE family protein [Azovibrio restrictus]|uniref:urease accessory protein UreH domain-containing protein n=1 Tax=Azovibrio restrictus TaxID=146938 RepID=UPI0026EE2ACA|nr:sulfite exporter TauE/SafE family protein [Azovibrio restrictus]